MLISLEKLKKRQEAIQALADGSHKDRAGVRPDDIRTEAAELFEAIEAMLATAYALTYLEAKIHCDEFFDGKNRSAQLGETYGYLSSYVRQESGTNSMRFSYRRPTPNGKFFQTNIKMATKGYTKNSFSKAAHEYEKNLGFHLEEQYVRLRDQGAKIKKAARLLRTVEILKDTDGKKRKSTTDA